MSFAGFKKQINKANQYMSEKIGGAEPTKPTEEFIRLETRTDLTNQVIDELITKTKDMLHPNPAIRARIAVSSKIGAKKEKYPHPERELGETMIKYGNQFGKESNLGQSLIEIGLTLEETTEIKYSLEESVRKKFLEPLSRLQLRDIKDCMHHRKKLIGRRLDFDCKKRKKLKGGNVFDQDIETAQVKYEESLKLATIAMQTLLENEKQRVSQMTSLCDGLYEYHSQCANIYKSLTTRLKNRYESKKTPDVNTIWSAAVDKTSAAVDQYKGVTGFFNLNKQLNNGVISTTNLVSNQSTTNNRKSINEWKHSFNEKPVPKCRALYEFKGENDNELSFKEGDVIHLMDQIDDQWFEGSHHGTTGLFPISYVEVLVPLNGRNGF